METTVSLQIIKILTDMAIVSTSIDLSSLESLFNF